MPLVILAGEEELLITERLDALKKELLDPAWAQFNFSRTEAPDIRQLIDASAAIPFGPGNKLILFDRCELFTKKRGKSDEEESVVKSKAKPDKLLGDLEAALSSVAEHTYIICCCYANFDKTLKISKVVEKHASIESFPKIKFWSGSANPEMLTWCRKRAHKQGAVIDDDAIDYLAESSEGNLRTIATEIEKAATYIHPEKKIDIGTVSKLSPHYSNVFALLDHWSAARHVQVLEALQQLFSKQQSAIPVIAVLQTTFSKWINIKLASERVLASLPGGRGIQRRQLPPAEMAKRIQSELSVNPWVLKMDLERIANLSLERLIEKKTELTRLENLVKTGQLNETHALSLFFGN